MKGLGLVPYQHLAERLGYGVVEGTTKGEDMPRFESEYETSLWRVDYVHSIRCITLLNTRQHPSVRFLTRRT